MLGPHTHRDNPLSRILCAPIAPPVTVCKQSDKTNTGEVGKGKKGRTVSDDAGGKSLSDTSTSAGVKSTAIRCSY